MDATIKKKWIDKALSLPKDLRGKEQLFDGKCFCYLGCLVELYREEVAPTIEWEPFEIYATRKTGYRFMGEDEHLPLEVKRWAGLDDFDPILVREKFTKTIEIEWTVSELNDQGCQWWHITKLVRAKL